MKKLGFVLTMFVMLIAMQPASAQQKISTLPSGAPLQSTDEMPLARSGTNVKGSLSDVETYVRTNNNVLSEVFTTAYNDCSQDITAAAEAFMEAHNGHLTLPTGCYLMSNLNPDSNLFIDGIGPPGAVRIQFPKRKSAILYNPDISQVFDSTQDVISIEGNVTVNTDDALTRIKVADASDFAVPGIAHITAQVGIPSGGSPQEISNISNANPAVVTYVGSDTFANGDIVSMFNVGGMTSLNNRSYIVSGVSTGSNTFNLTDINSANVNTSSLEAYNKGGYWVKTTASWKRPTSVTNANPPVVTANSVSSIANGDIVLFTDVKGMVELNGRAFKVANLSGSTFTLQTIAGTDVDATNWGKFQTSGRFTEGGGMVSGITQANPPVVTTSLYSGLVSNGDKVNFYGVNGTDEILNRTFKVANLNTGTGTFELQDLNAVNVDGTGWTAQKGSAFISESNRWVGEAVPITNVDYNNNYVYVRAPLRYRDLYTTNAKLSHYSEYRKGAIRNVQFEGYGDVTDPSVWYRLHAADVSGIPNMIFENVRGHNLWAGLTICRGCPGHRVINQKIDGSGSIAAADPYYDTSISSISSVTVNPTTHVVTVTRNSHGLVDNTHITIRSVQGMTEINEGDYVIADVTANTFTLKELNTLAYVDGTGWGSYTSGGVIYKRNQYIVSSLDTATDIMTTSASHGFTDGDEVYVFDVSGTNYSGIHNKVWVVDQQSTTTLKLQDNFGNYLDLSGTYSANSIRIEDADVKGLGYGHSIYGPSYGAEVSNLYADAPRHPVTTDGMGSTWSLSNLFKFGQATSCFIHDITTNGSEGPPMDGHEDASNCIFDQLTALNSARGGTFSSYVSFVGGQDRGFNNEVRNLHGVGGKLGWRLVGVQHHASSQSILEDFDIRELWYNAWPGSDYCVNIPDMNSLFFKPTLLLKGDNRCHGVTKPFLLQNSARLLGGGSNIDLYDIGTRAFDFDGNNQYVELGRVNVDFTNEKRYPASTKIVFYVPEKGAVIKVKELNVTLGNNNLSPGTVLMDVANVKPYTQVDIGKLRIWNPSNTTWPTLVSLADYPYVDFINYGPDRIRMCAGESAVATGTAVQRAVVQTPFLPIRYVASVATVSSSGNPTVDVNKAGTSIFGTNKLSIDASETSSLTAATPVDFAQASLDVMLPGDELTLDVDTAGTSAKNVCVDIQGYYLQ